jgi:hypothetical protein
MANRTGLFGTEKYPECPLVNHSNCRELHSPNFVPSSGRIKFVLEGSKGEERRQSP